MKMTIGRLRLFFHICLIIVNCFCHVSDAWASEQIAIKAGRLLDVETGKIKKNVWILVGNKSILKIGKFIPAKEAKIIDLSRHTVLPGLIDAHTHVLSSWRAEIGNVDKNMAFSISLPDSQRFQAGEKIALEYLEAGYTTIRDLGNSGSYLDIKLRNEINSGKISGPRMFVSGPALCPEGGQTEEPIQEIEKEYRIIKNASEAKLAVTEAISKGVDVIKVIIDSSKRNLTLEELNAIVTQAHAAKMRVAAHVSNEEAFQLAFKANVDSIEHGWSIKKLELFDLFKNSNVFFIPTNLPEDYWWATEDHSKAKPGEIKKKRSEGRKTILRVRDRLRRARAAGAIIVAGSDAMYDLPGVTRGQSAHKVYDEYLASGLSALEIIQAATIQGAKLLRVDHQIGSIEVGKMADIIAVEGNPKTSIRDIHKIKFVMKEGTIYSAPTKTD